jgi:FixJ family two-component response regulator
MVTHGEGKLVTIVDDDEFMREALLGLLKPVGLQANVFASAEEFLSSGLQHHTACLIADVRMPGMSVLELQAKLHEHHCNIPTIFITARGFAKSSPAESPPAPSSTEAVIERLQ